MKKNKIKYTKKLHYNNIVMDKCNNINVLQVQEGGKFLGQGTYGCVVTPEIECSSTQSTKKIFNKYSNLSRSKSSKSSNSNKSSKSSKLSKLSRSSRSSRSSRLFNTKVSKIILLPDDQTKEELDISRILHNIDPHQKYFVTYIEYCKVKNIPKNRDNLVSVKFTDTHGEYFKKLETKQLARNYCPVDISKKPINLIMPYAGYNLEELASFIIYKKKGKISKRDDKDYNEKLDLFKLLQKNFKKGLLNLLYGIYKMHQNRIVGRDIKIENITVNFTSENDNIQLRHIDFGLSEYLSLEYCKYYSNINIQGTPIFIPPEIFITSYINENRLSVESSILYKINKEIKNTIHAFCKDIGRECNNLNNIVIDKFSQILTQFNNKTILDKYFGITDIFNGYLQKADIYTFASSIYEFIIITEIIDIENDLKLRDLFRKMMEFDVNLRYNVLECLKHPYFK